MSPHVPPSPTNHKPGSIVRARGRDWVVLPSPDPDLLLLRPLTGDTSHTAGLFLPIEGHDVRPSHFAPPDPTAIGDAAGSLLLLDAARLSIRSGATPFRSFGQISVSPRPYQLVPLILALRQRTVRLLIADDVGVGKTIEAGLIARELLDRGAATRLAVLCPAHLCDQWAAELRDKFALDPRIVQPSQIARLQRELPRQDISIYQYYPVLVCSIDFVKSDRQADQFIRNAPDLLIVDEAHTAARPRGIDGSTQQQRYALVRRLADDPRRHLLLVTATPHSGIDESFASLVGLLRPELDVVPTPGVPFDRTPLLPHMVQRRRRDLVKWLGTDTPFPDRQSRELPYELSPQYLALFEAVLRFCRETVQSGRSLRANQQRVRHWAAIALLRCVLSSPETAEAVLAKRAGDRSDAGAEELLIDEIDAVYRPQVLDSTDEETAGDYLPAAPIEDAEPLFSGSERDRLLAFRRQARALAGPALDRKLATVIHSVRDLLAAGCHPIVFCRFIATANYVARHLKAELAGRFPRLTVDAVTGELGEEERRERIDILARSDPRVLVATDCLSEGINLQDYFDAVIHYDLPWNPNRLEQREGRVDRFGQRRPEVQVRLIHGTNNQVDITVLNVLIRKARAIRRQLGISVPVPIEPERVLQTIIDNVLLSPSSRGPQLQLDMELPEVTSLHEVWDTAAAREDEQRAYFSQHGIQPDEVDRELRETDPVLGSPETVRRFLANASQRFAGQMTASRPTGVYSLDPGDLHWPLAERGFANWPARVTFDPLIDGQALFLGRTHPVVATFAEAVLARALDDQPDPLFARAGAMFTTAVSIRTFVLLLRLRYLLHEETDQYAEEALLVACRRENGRLVWLQPLDSAARDLMERARPAANMPPAEARDHVHDALALVTGPPDWHRPIVDQRVQQLAEAHRRIRALLDAPSSLIEPCLPPDVLGCYVLVPALGGR